MRAHRGTAASARVRVLLAADGTSSGRLAEQAAAWMATQLGAHLDAIVVGPAAKDPAGREAEILFGHAVPDLGVAVAGLQARLAAQGVPADVHPATGAVAATIIETDRALAPDILVMGTHETGKVEFRGAGSVIDQVKNSVQASLLVARGPRPTSMAAAVDGSEPSLQAARLASRWATALGVPLTLLVGDGVAKLPGLGERHRVDVRGEPAGALLDWTRSHPAGLLVLGSRGQGNATLLHLGSVSDRLVLGAACSVLVVRPPRRRL